MTDNIETMETVAKDLMQDRDTSNHQPPTSPTAGLENNPTTLQVLGMEMQEHAHIAREYKQKIDEAKTEAKKKYFKKKLAKNNVKAFQILLALEEMGRLKKVQESETAPQEVQEQDNDGSNNPE